MFLVTGCADLLSHIALMLCTEVTREIATYNCPCVNTAFLRSNPTWSTDCPCDLLMVIAKQTLTGNCRRQNSKGTWVFDGVKPRRGMNVVVPACSPVNSLTSKTRLLSRVTTARVPLQTPSPGFKFLNTITGHPTFNFNFESGNPEQLIELRYSTG